MFIMTNPAYTKMCRIPATGRATIFDCPNATFAITFQRSAFLSVRLTSRPNKMLRLILRTLTVNKPMAAERMIRKRICPSKIRSVNNVKVERNQNSREEKKFLLLSLNYFLPKLISEKFKYLRGCSRKSISNLSRSMAVEFTLEYKLSLFANCPSVPSP